MRKRDGGEGRRSGGVAQSGVTDGWMVGGWVGIYVFRNVNCSVGDPGIDSHMVCCFLIPSSYFLGKDIFVCSHPLNR